MLHEVVFSVVLVLLVIVTLNEGAPVNGSQHIRTSDIVMESSRQAGNRPPPSLHEDEERLYLEKLRDELADLVVDIVAALSEEDQTPRRLR